MRRGARTRRVRRVLSAVAVVGLLATVPLLSAVPASATTCPPTLALGHYLGTWKSDVFSNQGVGLISLTSATATSMAGTVEMATNTTVLLPGAPISGSISCDTVNATSGPVSFTGTISPDATEFHGTYLYGSDHGTWQTGLVTQSTTTFGTTASTPGGTSSADPMGVSVVSPIAGTITIQEAIATGGSLAGYSLFDTVVRIDAPAGSTSSPLQLTFTVDASKTGGIPATSVVILRDGVVLQDCSGAPPGPIPCVSSRVDLAGGDVQLTVLTDHASTWNMAAAADSTPPTITPTVTGTLGDNGWYTSDVGISWTVVDGQSAITSTPGCGASQQTTDTAGATFTCTATSAGGTSSQTVTVMRDATPPSLAPGVSPNPVLLNGSATATSGASDAMSGLAIDSCDPVDATSVGSKTLTCSATDLAGNTTSSTTAYSVAFGFTGFFAPVDNPSVLNRVKAGRAIPMKWRIVDASGAPVTNLTSATLRVTSMACPVGTTVDQLEEVAAGASGLQNLGDGYYQINWKSPSAYAGSCKTATLDLGEGTGHSALFQFTS